MADSDKITAIFNKANYQNAKDEDELLSDKNPFLIFNTCSVRQKAEDRVFGLNKKLLELKDKNPNLKVVLTGCMMHYSEKELKNRLPHFDYFIDMKKIKKLSRLLPEAIWLKDAQAKTNASALIPISNGCNNFCTYCVVPLARGREISRTVLEILKDVRKAVADGAKEIWLLGQTVNSYKGSMTETELDLASRLYLNNANDPTANPMSAKSSYASVNFANLLRLINAINGDFWIRFASPHPKDFSDELIKAMTECEKFARYINLPIQSGNNAILKKMGRPYTVGHYKKLVKKIRKAMPEISLSTDIIVGFPGETRKQFEDTKKIFEEIRFSMAFISEYSPRPKTAAAKYFKDDVSHEEKERRKDELNEILKKTALENNQKLVGKTIKILNERTEGNKLIKITNVRHPMSNIKNEFALVKILKAKTWSLEGKLL